MIERVYVLNLDRHADRWHFMLGVLQSLNFPLEIVRRLKAMDGKDYDSVQAVNEAAAADGFSYFLDPDYQVEKYETTPPNKFMVAANWSYARAWRSIAKYGEEVMLLIDDHQPIFGWDYYRFDRLVEHLRWVDKQKFRLLQLQPQPMPYIDALFNRPAFDSILRRDIGGVGDTGLIMNKAGAELLLELHPRYGITDKCLDILSQQDRDVQQGCWHTVEPLVMYQYDFRSARLEETDD